VVSPGWRVGTVPVAGGHLTYRRTGGDGPPLVLSHGLTDNGLCWSRLATALAPAFDLIMLDARGHGESSGFEGVEVRDPARDLSEAIDALGLNAPMLMGHSVGARATAACAAARPGLAAKVILEDPPLVPPTVSTSIEPRALRFRNQVERFRAMTPEEITALGRAQSPLWHDDDFPAWTASKRQVDPDAMPVYATRWQDEIAALTCPTLLIRGDAEAGGMVTPTLADEAAALNPNVEVVHIPGAGHNVRRENFEAYLAAVRAFLE
jgi:pimeloyl-ACP methyl ester carboxylesterase